MVFFRAPARILLISDLKFPDPERDFIKRNRIDSTFILIPQGDQGETEVFYRTYDENGNILVDSTELHVTVRHYYDANGLLLKEKVTRHGREIALFDSMSYEFDRDSIILRQKWINSGIEYKFYFDSNGKLQQSVRLDQSERVGTIRKKRISYLFDGDLLRKILIYWDTRVVKEGDPCIEYDFYYSQKGILDSVTTKVFNTHRERSVFDSLGLIKSDGYKSETRFVHKRRL